MATEQQGPPASEGRPEDLPPTGWMQRPETFARRFLDADMYDVAVIMAQTAVEIATDDIVAILLRHHNLPQAI